MKRILVCGSREYENHVRMAMALMDEVKFGVAAMMIHGDCRGADRVAGTIARNRGWWVASCPADWNLGKKAGPLRNQQMLDEFHPDLVLAFPIGESKGTRGMIRLAEKTGIPCKIFESEESQ